MLPFSAITEGDGHEGTLMKPNLPPVAPTKHSGVGVMPISDRKSLSSSYQAKQIISLNPLSLKKHSCGRNPIHVRSKEEFLKVSCNFLYFEDMLVSYLKVVSRGGFHVGNGINWKGQVFSKMHNHTGVGNTLKRHYETYLLEYELAHDDVDGECCLLCQVAQQGIGLTVAYVVKGFILAVIEDKDLVPSRTMQKQIGLEYICPQCSALNFKKKIQKTVNGYA
ncbi:hypothetical protein ACH5RR_024286 [Cinchona calisaya]|uniref:ARID domain-containing protein n=1 Tax=Cinchona calisaya TaxID=153742 RepID=A0ABD2YYY8_9GENT